MYSMHNIFRINVVAIKYILMSGNFEGTFKTFVHSTVTWAAPSGGGGRRPRGQGSFSHQFDEGTDTPDRLAYFLFIYSKYIITNVKN